MIRRWLDRWHLGRKPGRAELGNRLATVIRERNKLAAQVVETQYALEQRERALGEAQQSIRTLGDKLQGAEDRDAEARRVLTGSGEATDRIARALRVLGGGDDA